MLKKLCIISVFAMTALAFTGCGNSKEKPSEATTQFKTQTVPSDLHASTDELIAMSGVEDIDKYVTLPKDYQKMKVTVEKEEATEKGLNDFINLDLDSVSIVKKTDKKVVEKDDIISVDYKTEFRGETVEEEKDVCIKCGKDEDYKYQSFSNNVQTNLVGKKVGDTFRLETKDYADNIVPPEGDSQSTKKEDVVYTGTIRYIGKPANFKAETLKDEDIPTIMEYTFPDETAKTVKEYRKIMKERYEESLLADYQYDIDTEIMDTVFEKTKFNIPKDVIKKNLKDRAKEYGISYEEYIKNATDEKYPDPENIVKLDYMRYALIKDMGIEVTKKDLEETFSDMLSSYYTYEDLCKDYGGKEKFLLSYAMGKADEELINTIRANSGLTETKE